MRKHTKGYLLVTYRNQGLRECLGREGPVGAEQLMRSLLQICLIITNLANVSWICKSGRNVRKSS